jgi:hypothetical protein
MVMETFSAYTEQFKITYPNHTRKSGQTILDKIIGQGFSAYIDEKTKTHPNLKLFFGYVLKFFSYKPNVYR